MAHTRNPDYRNIHRIRRNEMEREETEKLSCRICSLLLDADWYPQAEIIFSYYPLGNEVSTLPAHKQILADGKILALPRVEGSHMSFYRIRSETELQEGSFHIKEPVPSCEKIELLPDMNPAVLVPGLVFDEHGNRYGYGKGYYDRFFAEHPQISRRFALAYEHQIEPEIPIQKTDIPMTRIYTETGCRRITAAFKQTERMYARWN